MPIVELTENEIKVTRNILNIAINAAFNRHQPKLLKTLKAIDKKLMLTEAEKSVK